MEIIKNKKLNLNYILLDTFECGIILKGSEVKSLRKKYCNISDSYVSINKNFEAFLINSHIAKFDKSNIFNHEEKRERKLLLNKREIIKLKQKTIEQGLSIIPTKIYTKDSLIKIEVAICRGKKNYDKRQTLIDRENDKQMKKAIKNYVRE